MPTSECEAPHPSSQLAALQSPSEHPHQPLLLLTMASVISALGDLTQSVASIITSLLNSFFAVLQAIFALLQDFAGSVLQLAQSLVAFFADVFQGVVGFVAGEWTAVYDTQRFRWLLICAIANFFGILLVGGVYYWYTHRQGGSRSPRSKRIA